MRTATWLACFCALLLMGCGSQSDKWKKDRPKTAPAVGVITLNGKPLDGAQVVLVPTSGSHGASALSATDGTFSLSAFPPDDGAVPGSYKVMIVKSIVPELQEGDTAEMAYAKLLVPKKYTDANTSGLTVDIPDSGKSDINLALEGTVDTP